jgi:hypothetical protein
MTTQTRSGTASFLSLFLALAACSDPEGPGEGPGGAGTTGGTPGSDGTGGSPEAGGVGGAITGAGGSGNDGGQTSVAGGAAGAPNPGSGGAPGAAGGGASGGAGSSCPSSGTFATKIEAKVHWAQTATIVAGSGTISLWSRDVLTFANGQVTGTTARCGQTLVDFTVPEAFVAFLGGSKIGTTVPDATWDTASMPKTPIAGTFAAPDAGGAFALSEAATVLGMNLVDPVGEWPALAAAQASAADSDGDGSPGFTQVPKSDSPFARPPLSLTDALNANGLRADRLYVVNRMVSGRTGTFDGCTSIRGTATGHPSKEVHVIGCHVLNGAECAAAQVQFADTQLTAVDVVVDSQSFVSHKVDDGATCAAVRTAVP